MTDAQHVPNRSGRRKPRALRARRAAAALSVASFVTIGGAMAILESPSSTQVASRVASRVASKATTAVATNSSSTGSSTTATTTPHTTTRGS